MIRIKRADIIVDLIVLTIQGPWPSRADPRMRREDWADSGGADGSWFRSRFWRCSCRADTECWWTWRRSCVPSTSRRLGAPRRKRRCSSQRKNAITKFSHLTRCPRLTRQFHFRFCSGKQSKLFYGLYALNLVHSAEVHQVERMSSLKMHSAIFVQSVQIDWLGLKGTFSTTVSCLRKVCCG